MRARATGDDRGPGTATATYVELPPAYDLTGVVRTVWVQQVGESAYVQRHLPTGGMELHLSLGSEPRLVGPLTRPVVEVMAPRTTVLGVRFMPGSAPPLPEPVNALTDLRVDAREMWGSLVDRMVDDVATAPGTRAALDRVQASLVGLYRQPSAPDGLVREAVGRLMPWNPVQVSRLADQLAISSVQLRRRFLRAVGVAPKALQRTLRFQGFLALAQAGAPSSHRRHEEGLAGLAVDAGYADQAHLGRECLRLTGLTPRELLGARVDGCSCGHDHAASYRPFLATRTVPAAPRMSETFKSPRRSSR